MDHEQMPVLNILSLKVCKQMIILIVPNSRDHKTVYVGDAKGRVYSWSVTDQPGRAVADHWIKDDSGDSCVNCAVKFSFSERRHHCRNCGQLFCSK